MSRARVLLADDHRIVAEDPKELLAPEFELLGLVEDGRTLVEEAKKLRPDVIVADVTMPDLNGIDALAQMEKSDPGVKVVSHHASGSGLREARDRIRGVRIRGQFDEVVRLARLRACFGGIDHESDEGFGFVHATSWESA